MILRILFIITLFFNVSFCAIEQAVKAKDVNENVKATRIFDGIIEKIGFFKSLSLPYQYCLVKDKNCIAFLDSNEKLRMPEIFKAFLNKKVHIKGIPQYINKEPYLVISVTDVSEQL